MWVYTVLTVFVPHEPTTFQSQRSPSILNGRRLPADWILSSAVFRMKKLSPSQSRVLFSLAMILAATWSFGSIHAQDQEVEPNPSSTESKESTDRKAQTEETLADANDEEINAEEGDEQNGETDVKPMTVIKNATLVTPKSIGANQSIFIEGDQIQKVTGPDAEIPEDATVIDAMNGYVSSGFIDLRSRFGMSDESAASVSDGSTQAIDGFDAYTTDYESLWSQGVTTVHVQPSNQSLFGGMGAAFDLTEGKATLVRDGVNAQAAFVNASPNIRFHFAEFERLKKTLNGLVEYKKKWDAYNEYLAKQEKKATAENDKKSAEKNSSDDSKQSSENGELKKGEGDSERSQRGPRGRRQRGATKPPETDQSKSAESKDSPADAKKQQDAKKDDGTDGDKQEGDEKPVEKPDRDVIKDRLLPILDGSVPVYLEVHSASDTANALKLQEEFEDIVFVFEGLSNVGELAEQITASRNPIVLGPWLDAQRTSIDHPDRLLHWSQSLVSHTGLVAISTFANSSRDSKWLRHHAAQSIAVGLAPEQALRAITVNPARILGLESSHGDLSKGKRANLAVFSGMPLDTTSSVWMTMVHGKIVYQSEPVVENSEAESTTDGVGARRVALPDRLPKAYGLRCQNVWVPGEGFTARCIVVRDGKVAKMAAINANIDQKLAVFDLGEAYVTHGFRTAHAAFGLGQLLQQEVDSDASNLSSIDVLDQQTTAIRRLIDGGFSFACFAPTSNQTLAGLVSLSSMVAPNSGDKAAQLLKLSLTASARGSDEFPASLDGQLQLARDALSGRPSVGRLFVPDLIEQSILKQKMAAAAEYVSQQMPLLVQANSRTEVSAALRIAKEYALPLTLVYPNEVGFVQSSLVDQDVTLVIRPFRANDPGWFSQEIVEAAKAGVDIAIAGENPVDIRLTASTLVAHGLNEIKILDQLQTWPAQWSNAVGKATQGDDSNQSIADFVVWDRPPLDLAANVIRIIHGTDGNVARLSTSKALLTNFQSLTTD